ncbi:hypothetical protein J6590_030467 [Homalodisca vitripennis]|nr:hypothetical protein J6590_030467 [Homalodisca vitripennis]
MYILHVLRQLLAVAQYITPLGQVYNKKYTSYDTTNLGLACGPWDGGSLVSCPVIRCGCIMQFLGVHDTRYRWPQLHNPVVTGTARLILSLSASSAVGCSASYSLLYHTSLPCLRTLLAQRALVIQPFFGFTRMNDLNTQHIPKGNRRAKPAGGSCALILTVQDTRIGVDRNVCVLVSGLTSDPEPRTLRPSQ